MFHTYVLKSLKDGFRYYGVTNHLERRIAEHNRGKTRSTKPRRPFILVYSEEFETFEKARDREIYFKSRVGRRFLDKLLINSKQGPVV